eukprot:SAG11_NODE_2846_length_2911_cov_2.406117_1_plen_39_part_10
MVEYYSCSMLLNLEYRTQYIYSFVLDILRLVDLAFDSYM